MRRNVFHRVEEMRTEDYSKIGKRNTLVFTLNKNGEIVEFDKGCQKITGYPRDEVLTRKILDFLIPENYIKQWGEMFDLVLKNGSVDNFKIPWKTCEGKEILISWSCFFIEDNKGLVKDICFIGKEYGMNYNEKDSLETSKNYLNSKMKTKKIRTEIKKDDNKSEDNAKVWKDKDMTIFAKKISTEPNKTFNASKNVIFSEIEKSIEDKPIKSGKMNRSIRNFSKKYGKFNKKFKELEKRNEKLVRKNKILEEKLKNIEKHMGENDNKLNKKPKNEETTSQKTENNVSPKKWPDFFSNPFKEKNKQEKIADRIPALDERKKELDELETQLIMDKKDLDKRITEFSNWKEKLLNLESEIEKRRNDLIEQETAFREKFISMPKSEIKSNVSSLQSEDVSKPEENVAQDDYHDILDKITQGAAIIQRGILKQVNNSFAELIGFDDDELMNKNLFDFIAPEGFADLEKYYLNRLKGEDVSTYETILLTGDDQKIPVEINIKPTLYNGETAEMAVVRLLADAESEEDNNQ